VLHMLGDMAGLFMNGLPLLFPGLGQGEEEAFETGPAVAIVRREISAAVEWLQVGGEEHRHGPTALPGHELDGRHVNLIQVRPFLAIYLDTDKMPVEDVRHFCILEALVLHDMAPVAGRVADAEKDGPI